MRRTTPQFPPVSRAMEQLGERIRLARLRRKLSQDLLSRRAGMSRATLQRIEAGDPGVSLGALANVLYSLGLHADLDRVAADDELGRSLQDLGLKTPRRAPRKGQGARNAKAHGHLPHDHDHDHDHDGSA